MSFPTQRRARLIPAVVAASLAIAGCTGLPPARPIDTTTLYERSTPLLRVKVDDTVVLDRRAPDPPMAVRVVYPDGRGPWPLIVFSHGMFSSNRNYMPILEYWAARGYVIVAPNHLDANGGFAPRRNEDVEQLAASRALDLTLAMDALPAIADAIPGLAHGILPPPYAGAGHSMGTYITMLAAGLRTRNPTNGIVTAHADRRIGMIVMSSDPGKMALMPDQLWRAADVPTFMATGSADYGSSGKGRRATDYTAEVLREPGDSGAAVERGHHFRVDVEGADHYYGGLVHRDPGGLQPDYDALAIYNALSTAFLDAYERQDTAAREYLRRIDLAFITGNRATLSRE